MRNKQVVRHEFWLSVIQHRIQSSLTINTAQIAARPPLNVPVHEACHALMDWYFCFDIYSVEAYERRGAVKSTKEARTPTVDMFDDKNASDFNMSFDPFLAMAGSKTIAGLIGEHIAAGNLDAAGQDFIGSSCDELFFRRFVANPNDRIAVQRATQEVLLKYWDNIILAAKALGKQKKMTGKAITRFFM